MVRPNIEDPATERVFLRLSSGDKDRVRRLADEADLSLSAYILSRVLPADADPEPAVPASEAAKARAALARALRKGLVRPGPCAHAHKGACKRAIGGHHASTRVERWLDITWLCGLHLEAEEARLKPRSGKKPRKAA